MTESLQRQTYPFGQSEDWRRSPCNQHHFLPLDVGGDPFAATEFFGVMIGDQGRGWIACRLGRERTGSCEVLNEHELPDIRDAMRVCEEHRVSLPTTLER
ncbi:hypothetical protein PsAD5_00134 [Pseudovibrio sp. Ad5]|nr:hypothetical protein PsAD5_00134 [Pseudovibrio sp. Ad5]